MSNPKPVRASAALKARRYLGPLVWLALFFAFLVQPGSPQNGQATRNAMAARSPLDSQNGLIPDYSGGTGASLDPVMQQHRMKMLNSERHKAMVSDVDRLVKLATELNNEIGRSNPGTLTPAQLRKVAEIEKLAHGVREKMTMTLPTPSVMYFPVTGMQ